MSFINMTTMTGLLDDTVLNLLKKKRCSTVVFKKIWQFTLNEKQSKLKKQLQNFKIKEELNDYQRKKEVCAEKFLKNIHNMSSDKIDRMIKHCGNFSTSLRMIHLIVLDKNLRQIYLGKYHRYNFIKYGPYSRVRAKIV